jgi:hypothetical protein
MSERLSDQGQAESTRPPLVIDARARAEVQ